MSVRFNGYKSWKHIKDELDLYSLYILPFIAINRDGVFDKNLSRNKLTSIQCAWLFWSLEIYFEE